MILQHTEEHLQCFNYCKGKNASLEILKRDQGFSIVRDLIVTEIVFVIKGAILLSYDKLIKEKIPVGKIMFFPPGSHVRAEMLEDTEMVICRVKDVASLCECLSLERLHKITGVTEKRFHMLEINERLYSFIRLFRDYVDDGFRCSDYFDTKMKELFLLLRAYYSKNDLAFFFSPLLGKDAQFMILMYKNYRNVKSVKELADLSMYSLSGFKKQFQKVFGMPASEWMNGQKAIRVFQDLNNSGLSIKELADKHDFSSTAAFTSFCQQKFGMPPGRIRLNINNVIPELKEVAN